MLPRDATLPEEPKREIGRGGVRHLVPPGKTSGEPRDAALADLGAVRGVVIQKSVPGRRRLTKFYV